MKKVFSLILALGLIASLTACGGGNASGNETGDSAPAASTAKLRFVTGGESGTYYAFGSVIAQHATNNTDVSVTGLVGNGSKSNVEELADGNAELAFCQFPDLLLIGDLGNESPGFQFFVNTHIVVLLFHV